MYGSSPSFGPGASPNGMLLSGAVPFTRKAQATWASAGQIISGSQAVAGALILLLSWAFFYEFTEATGVILGLAMLLAGAIGWIGGRQRNSNVTNLHVLVTLVALLLSFNFIGQVVREVHVDCGLAELYLKNRALESRIEELREAEAMHSVHERMNEMEEMLDLVQRGAVKSVELKAEQDKLKHLDASYISAKLHMLRQHAQDVMDGILKNPGLNASFVNSLTPENKEYLRKRLDAADKVLERIRQHHEVDGKSITLEEYQELLGVLTDPQLFDEKRHSADLTQAKHEIPNMGAALSRAKENRYSDYLPGTAHHELQAIENMRAQRRKVWEDRLQMLMDVEEKDHDIGAELAEHCVKETRGHSITLFFGMIAVGLQLCSAYTSLCLGMRLSVKGE